MGKYKTKVKLLKNNPNIKLFTFDRWKIELLISIFPKLKGFLGSKQWQKSPWYRIQLSTVLLHIDYESLSWLNVIFVNCKHLFYWNVNKSF